MGIDPLSYDTNILRELKNPNNYMDAIAEAQVLGIFMHNADLLILNQFEIRKDDFNLEANAMIFGFMVSIIGSGGLSLTASDIKASFSKNAMRKRAYIDAGGDKYLSDLETYAEPQNFQMHATNLKKWSLIRKFATAGFDVTYYHIPARLVNDLFTMKQKGLSARTPNDWESEVNRRFEDARLIEIKSYFSNQVDAINDSVVDGNFNSFKPVDFSKEYVVSPPIVKGFLRRNTINQIYAESGKGKTWLGLNLALCLLNGISLGINQDGETIKADKTKVAYFDFELGSNEMCDRVVSLKNEFQKRYLHDSEPALPYNMPKRTALSPTVLMMYLTMQRYPRKHLITLSKLRKKKYSTMTNWSCCFHT